MALSEAPRAGEERWSPTRELRDSVMLLVLTVSSLGAYLALGVLAVRIFAGR